MFSPKFFITKKLLANLADLEKAKEYFSRNLSAPTQELQKRKQILIRRLYSSFEVKDDVNYAENKLPDDNFEEIGSDAVNYQNAIAYIKKFIATGEKLTPKIILDLHRISTGGIVHKGEPGQFRTGSAGVYLRRDIDFKIIGVLYSAPDFEMVPSLVGNLIEFIERAKKEGAHPLIIAGLAFYELIYIHPFYDGNNRTAYALATMIILENWADFTSLFSLRDYQNALPDSHNLAINTGKNYLERQNADLTNWLEYFIGSFHYFFCGLISESK